VDLGTAATVRLKSALGHDLVGLLLNIVCAGQTQTTSIKDFGPFLPVLVSRKVTGQDSGIFMANFGKNMPTSKWRLFSIPHWPPICRFNAFLLTGNFRFSRNKRSSNSQAPRCAMPVRWQTIFQVAHDKNLAIADKDKKDL
jgi:hypothetical protein